MGMIQNNAVRSLHLTIAGLRLRSALSVLIIAATLLASPGQTRSSTLTDRIADARSRLLPSYLADRLQDMLRLDDREFDVATAALLIEKEVNPSLDVAAERSRFDAWVDRFAAKLPPESSDLDILRALAAEVKDLGIVLGAEPEDSFLSNILARKRGDCTSGTLFYLAAGQRLGLRLQMAVIPKHAFIRYVKDGQVWDVETLAGDIEGPYPDLPEKSGCIHHLPIVRHSSAAKVALLLSSRSVIWVQNKQLDKAAMDMDLAAKMDPDNPQILLNRGVLKARQGEESEALADLGRALKLNLCLDIAYGARGDVFVAQGSLEEAKSDYEELVRLRIEAAAFALALQESAGSGEDAGALAAKSLYACCKIRELTDGLIRRATVSSGMGDHEEAIDGFSGAINLLEESELYYDQWEDANSAGATAGNRRAREAEVYFSVFKTQFDLSDAYRARGDEWASVGNHDEAITDYTKAIDCDAADVFAYAGRMTSLIAKRDVSGAKADLREIKRLLQSGLRAKLSKAQAASLHKRLELLNAAIAQAEKLDGNPNKKEAE